MGPTTRGSAGHWARCSAGAGRGGCCGIASTCRCSTRGTRLCVSVFFFIERTYILVKETVHRRIQIHPEGDREQLSHLLCTKDPTENRNCSQVPESYACCRKHRTAPSPDCAADEEPGYHPDLEEPHRTKTFGRAEVDTRPGGRDEGIADRPSAGAAPRALQILNRRPPSTTTATTGSPSSIHPASFLFTHNLL